MHLQEVEVEGQGVVEVVLVVGVKGVKLWVKAVQLGVHKEEGEEVREAEKGVKGAGEGVREAEKGVRC
nr:hypothetical protein [Tanacetum cinerariifolium]